MTADLSRGLAALAEESKQYANAAAAVAADRRHRRWRVAVPVAGALVASMVAGLVVAHRRPSPEPVRPAPLVALVLPAVVTPPTGAVPALPADRPVGQGALLYRPCPVTCPAYLVTVSGEVYTVDVPRWTGGSDSDRRASARDLEASLSPDGRYLTVSTGPRTTVRDLTGTVVRTFPLARVIAWSADDRFIADFDDQVDLRTGAVTPLQSIFAGFDGDDRPTIVMGSPDDQRTTGLLPVDSRTGLQTLLDARSLLTPGEAVSVSSPPQDGGRQTWSEVAFGPGDRVAVSVFRPQVEGNVLLPNAFDRIAVALGDGMTGHLTQRVTLRPGAAPPFFLGDQVVYATQVAKDAPILVYGVTPSGGSVVLSRLPAQAEYTIAGMGGLRGALLGEAYGNPLIN